MVQRVKEPMIKMQTKHNFFNLWKKKREESHSISCYVSEQKSRFLVGNQAGIEKLVIGMRTDLTGNDQGTKNGLQNKYIGLAFP